VLCTIYDLLVIEGNSLRGRCRSSQNPEASRRADLALVDYANFMIPCIEYT